jgi:RNA polymerase sigma factor (sigma-70 family)
MDDEQRHSRLSRISTVWTLVLQAHKPDEESLSEAQRALMECYSGAAYRYLLGAVKDEDAAEELFQEFAIRFLRGGFRRADPQRGRFRDFLKAALINLVNDFHTREAKRRQTLHDPEMHADRATPAEDPDLQFIESWREELIARAWDTLADVEKAGGQPFHTLLKMHVEDPKLRSAQLAERLTGQLKLETPLTEAGVRKTLQRAREKLTSLLLDEVAHSLGGASLDEVEEELIDLGMIHYCRAALNRRRGG